MSRPEGDSPGQPAPAWSTIAAVVGIAFIVKLIIWWQLADHPMLHADSGLDTTAYAELARRVANGDVLLSPGVYYLSPLYIYALAAGLAVTGSFEGARLLQAALGAASVGGIWYLTQCWSNRRAAWWAAGLAIVTGVMTFYEVIILQASLDIALATAALISLTLAVQQSRPLWHVTTGLAFGFAALNRPNMTLVVGGLALWLLVTRRFRAAALLVAGLLVAFAPVAVRNGVVAGEWFTVSSHGGLNLYIGNNERASGFYREVPGISPSIAGQARDTRLVAGAALGREVTDAEASDYFVGLAVDWATSHPVDAAALFLKKVAHTFHAAYVALPQSYPFYVSDSGAWLWLLPVGPWLLMPLGLVGLAVLVRQWPSREAAIGWTLFVPLYASAVAVFFVADRYRLPLLVPMCVGAGIALEALVSAVRVGNWRSVRGPIAVFVVLLLAVNAPTALNEGRWTEGLRLAQRLAILGRDAEVRPWVERLAPEADPPGSAHHLVGRQYLVEGKAALALPYLREARAIGLDHPRVLADLAEAFEGTGDTTQAERTLSGIVPDAGEPAPFWLQLGRQATTLQALELAGRFFAQAVALTPGDADARLQFGVNLVLRNEIASARAELGEAVRLAPGQPDALAYLAYCEAAVGDLDAARRHASTALEIDPAHQVARSVLGAIR